LRRNRWRVENLAYGRILEPPRTGEELPEPHRGILERLRDPSATALVDLLLVLALGVPFRVEVADRPASIWEDTGRGEILLDGLVVEQLLVVLGHLLLVVEAGEYVSLVARALLLPE
jgi:hypothetical protein